MTRVTMRTILFCLALLPATLRGQGFPDDSAAARRYLSVLDVRVKLGKPFLRSQDTVRLHYTVTNRSSETLVLCMGKGHGADLVAGADTIQPFILVDHESCVRTDTLRAHQSVTWQRTLALPEFRATGPSTLIPWIDIVDPTACG